MQPALAEGTLSDPMVQGMSSLLSLIVNKSIFIQPLSALTIHYCRFTHDALSCNSFFKNGIKTNKMHIIHLV